MAFRETIKNLIPLLIIIVFVFVMISPLPHNSLQEKVIATTLLIIGFGLTALLSHWNRQNGKTPENRRENTPWENRPAVIFGSIYSIINGLGMAQALEDYVKMINLNLANFSAGTLTSLLQIANVETFRLFGFFLTQIPFLHGGVLLLLSDIRYIGNRSQYLLIMIFVGLLIHAALFYFIGSNLLNFPLFIFFIWVLFVFNPSWLCVMKLLFWELRILPEWIHLNLITAAFLFTYFLYPYFINSNYTITDDYWSNFILLFVLFSRTALDYVFGWTAFYSPKKGQVTY